MAHLFSMYSLIVLAIFQCLHQPQNFSAAVYAPSEEGGRYVLLMWAKMEEPDVRTGGNVFIERRIKTEGSSWGGWIQIAEMNGGAFKYYDYSINTAGQGGDSAQYRLCA